MATGVCARSHAEFSKWLRMPQTIEKLQLWPTSSFCDHIPEVGHDGNFSVVWHAGSPEEALIWRGSYTPDMNAIVTPPLKGAEEGLQAGELHWQSSGNSVNILNDPISAADVA